MPRLHSYIRLTAAQRTELESFMRAVVSRDPPDRLARRRAQTIWYSSQGKSVQEICKHYRCVKSAVWSWFAAYRRSGVKGLLSRPVSKRLSQLQRDKLWQMKKRTLASSPTTSRSGKERWTYPGLARWVKKNWGVRVSPRRLNQLLANYSTAVRTK